MNPSSPISAASSSGPGTLTASDAHGASRSKNTLLENFSNYKNSAPPSRIMFHAKGAWVDFPTDAFESLRSGFVDGRRIAMEVEIEGSAYVVDFLRMQRSDLSTGDECPIAWIDSEGRAFFPKNAAGVEIGDGFRSKLDLAGHGDRNSTEEGSDESPEVSSVVGKEDGSVGDCCTASVVSLFESEMRKADRDVVVSSVRRCGHSSATGAVRLRTFQARAQGTRGVRGNANVRGGWYVGSSLEELEGIVRYGFGRPNSDKLGDGAYGIGVHLIPPQALHSSSALPEVDGDGEKHLLFCRVIMGSPEKAERGSTRFHPSSEQFDSAVDEFQNPNWYIVWSTHMNTHIIPECIVSFSSSSHRHQGMTQTRKSTFSTRRTYPLVPLTFLQLYDELGRLLPPSTMKALDILFDRYKAKKLQKEVFVRNLRSVAGTNVICEAIKRMKHRL